MVAIAASSPQPSSLMPTPSELNEFVRQIAVLRDRVAPADALHHGLADAPEVHQDHVVAMLEELQVAQEEMLQQADELESAHAIIERERARFEDLFEHAPDAYVVTDANGIIQRANAMAEPLFGLPRRFLVGKPLVVFISGDTRGAFHRQLISARSQEEGEDHRLKVASRGGEPVTVSARARRAGDAACGELRWILRDASDQVHAEERLRQLNERLEQRVVERTAALADAMEQKDLAIAREHSARMEAERASEAKSDFLAVLSHEFRTPLQAIFGYAELLETGIHGPLAPAQRQDMARIRDGLSHLVKLVNQVLDHASIEAHRVQLEMEAVSVERVVALAEALVAPQIEERELSLARENAPPDLRVHADADRLQQVLINLLGNAIKFTARGGAIRIEFDVADEWVTIGVRDTGEGIPPDKLDSVFEPYVRVASGGARPTGTGLGLSISRDLVRLMGGQLRAESTVGVGSAFLVTLRRAACA